MTAVFPKIQTPPFLITNANFSKNQVLETKAEIRQEINTNSEHRSSETIKSETKAGTYKNGDSNGRSGEEPENSDND